MLIFKFLPICCSPRLVLLVASGPVIGLPFSSLPISQFVSPNSLFYLSDTPACLCAISGLINPSVVLERPYTTPTASQAPAATMSSSVATADKPVDIPDDLYDPSTKTQYRRARYFGKVSVLGGPTQAS